ncbi:hypothetical protein D3C76_83660 [compost metagenome]
MQVDFARFHRRASCGIGRGHFHHLIILREDWRASISLADAQYDAHLAVRCLGDRRRFLVGVIHRLLDHLILILIRIFGTEADIVDPVGSRRRCRIEQLSNLRQIAVGHFKRMLSGIPLDLLAFLIAVRIIRLYVELAGLDILIGNSPCLFQQLGQCSNLGRIGALGFLRRLGFRHYANR